MAKAILRFFAGWDPQTAEENAVLAPEWEKILKGGNLVFCMDGVYAQDVPEIAQAWDEAYADDEKAEMGRCLVTGQKAPVAILHPSVNGVVGARPSGATLVSFNAPSLESFGKDDRDKQGQGRNAPVSTYAAFAYTEALNYLLREPAYHSRLGDTTLIYWAEGAKEEYSSAMAGMMVQRQHGARRPEERYGGFERRKDRPVEQTAAETRQSLLHSGPNAC